MLCCVCLFVELIDRREGVLWKQKRNTREGQGGGGSRVVFLKGCGLFPPGLKTFNPSETLVWISW